MHKNKLTSPNLNDLVKQITENISKNGDNQNIDQVIDQVTNMMSGMMGGAANNKNMKEDIKKMTKGILSNLTSSETIDDNMNSKIDLKQTPSPKPSPTTPPNTPQSSPTLPPTTSQKEMYEVLDDDEVVDELNPVMDDIEINLNVSLEELYNGAKKKIQITRKRIGKDFKIFEEKKKLLVDIKKGYRDEQVIRFNRQGDEGYGKETGDIVVILKQNGHNVYEREKDTLFVTKKISLFESYAAATGLINITLQTLDNRILVLDSLNIPLHLTDGLRKIEGEGMPTIDGNKGDLYIRFHLILPDKFDSNLDSKLKNICPPVYPDVIYNDNSNEGIDIKHMKNIKKCFLKEVTEEDLDKLKYDQSESDSESSDGESSYD